MERRTFLKWLTHGLGAAFAATIGAPAALFLIDPRNRPTPPSDFRTVARLNQLKIDEPFQAIIRTVRRDAWTLHPNDVVGRVWLIRRDERKVDAYTVICPHLGCPINFIAGSDSQPGFFQCPCHNGSFDIQCKKLPSLPNGATNPAPRDMDSLPMQLVADPADPNENLVQVKYQNFVQGLTTKVEKT
ncbi:MAG TPA: Rieske 2Fe-2S domain-containing protein [Gemmataceae bacterium]|nr:Rieske 2Fe-2S domain-containing protein [Gemmataceae bacterium]